jgi:predicted TIM-barrel fold metal-dependent hydrolase
MPGEAIRYTTAVRPDEVRAIDMHVHVESSVATPPEQRRHPVMGFPLPSVTDLAEMYRGLGMAAVVFTVDAPHRLGHGVSNEEIATVAAENSDVLIPFASLDPVRRTDAVATARRLVEEHGMRGFKFHPGLQGFYPNDPKVYPLYSALEELGVPAIFHTGQLGGGNGARLKYCDPIALDDVAVDFPELRLIMAHPSFPWQDVALSVAGTREHVYIDLSGWSPRYFPPQLIQHANTILKNKMLFGSDFPIIPPERWLADFEEAAFRPEVREGILKTNAARLLELS